ncbi:hypothetical protein VTJ04DRAFT_9131 [Mycothermus thermophilus]|uniref:uncharacterized protein n=1 Tax=Humicola insolens TaxID=85995 RepID=UPI003743BB37
MSHQRYPSGHDASKEPHPVTLKVLRLSRPSLVAQYPLQLPLSADDPISHPPPNPASLAYQTNHPSSADDNASTSTNPSPFLLTPILNLPPSFGSAYVGETFSCTLCASHDVTDLPAASIGGGGGGTKTIRDVRIEAEMKTPSTGTGPPIKLTLIPLSSTPSQPQSQQEQEHTGDASSSTPPVPAPAGEEEKAETGVDLPPSSTLQKILAFDLKESGPHVLIVTVSYYEATALAGRTRQFRKLYQFVAKPSLIVRTKPGVLAPRKVAGSGEDGKQTRRRRWVLEAQLENCGEDALLLERVEMVPEEGLRWEGWNWEGDLPPPLGFGDGKLGVGLRRRPVLQPGETEQVCFVLEEAGEGAVKETEEGRVVFGPMKIAWRSEMGNKGVLTTGALGTRVAVR